MKRNHIRIDAVDLTRTVHKGILFNRNRTVLLDHISLSIPPGMFVAVVGGSGVGKTVLLNALSGQQPAEHGVVLYNGENFYEHAADFTALLGYVPQDDIIHKNLTVERALYYAARMRLPASFTRKQIRDRIKTVLEEVDMTPQRHQLISALSGGQRKRVSIGVELLADPPIFFLDEPTSGLDPGLDRTIMELLRRLADRGHTIILSTHTIYHIEICDAICFLAPGGRLAYCGSPESVKQFFQTSDYSEIYNKIYSDPEHWVTLFELSPEHVENVLAPQQQPQAGTRPPGQRHSSRPPRKPRRNPLRQWRWLTERYLELIARDRTNLFILLAQAPIIAGLTVMLARDDVFYDMTKPGSALNPVDIYAQRTLFIMVCSAIWFGTINAAREIVKERPIYQRERAINLGIMPYIASKVVVLGLLCAIQSFLLLYIVGVRAGYPTSGLLLSGMWGAFLEMYISLLLMAFAGLALGLVVSSLAPNTDRAVSMVPILLIPQIIFANVIFSLSGAAVFVSWIMPSRWGMQAIGSIARLRDRFTDHTGKPFYTADQAHLVSFWLALLGLAAIFLLLTLFFQRRKDLLR